LIPGIPENMRILLVNQIEEESSHALDLSITQYVVQSDARREAASEQYERGFDHCIRTLYEASY
jgi:hypothetical protein